MDRFRRERATDIWKLICGVAAGLAVGAVAVVVIGLAIYLYRHGFPTR